MSSLRPIAPLPDDLRAVPIPGQVTAATVRPMAGNPTTFFDLNLARSLQLHRRMAFAIIATAVVLAAAYMARGWNHYTAEAQVYVNPAPTKVMENGTSQRLDAPTYESYIQQQIHNVTRPDVLLNALHRMSGWQRGGESEQAAVARLGRAVEVSRVGAGYQLSITAKASKAAEAAQIANAVSASFIESATNEMRAGDSQRLELLREERDRIQKELASDRAEQDDLNRKLGVAAVSGSVPDPIDEQISAVRGELIKARAANDEAAARLTALANIGANSAALDAEADEIVSSDAGMVSMKTALNKRRSDLISQMANLTPNHPQYKQDSEELAKINTSLEAMTKDLRAKAAGHIQQRLKNELESTSGLEGKLNAQLAQLTGAAGTATPRLQRSNELATDIVRLQNRFAIVDEQFHNVSLENSAPGDVYQSFTAAAPLNADHSKTIRNGLVVILVGLVLGLGSALLAHNLDPRIYIAADVERVLGFAPMAQLPDFSEVGTGVSDEYLLRLAAAVEHAYQEGALKSCIFTGVAPGAGATTVATRVTSMLEAMGRETVLVDASGNPPPAPTEDRYSGSTELVPSQRGSRSTALLQQMAEKAAGDAIVVTDTAPLLVSGETEYLARFVDSTVVVIESGVTTRTQLRELAETLQRLEVSAVGFVLNRVSLKKAGTQFRHSVRAVEQHLHSQTRSYSRNASRKRSDTPVQPEGPTEPEGGRAFRAPATEPWPDRKPRPSSASAAKVAPAAPVSTDRNSVPEPVWDRVASAARPSTTREPVATPRATVSEPIAEPKRSFIPNPAVGSSAASVPPARPVSSPGTRAPETAKIGLDPSQQKSIPPRGREPARKGQPSVVPGAAAKQYETWPRSSPARPAPATAVSMNASSPSRPPKPAETPHSPTIASPVLGSTNSSKPESPAAFHPAKRTVAPPVTPVQPAPAPPAQSEQPVPAWSEPAAPGTSPPAWAPEPVFFRSEAAVPAHEPAVLRPAVAAPAQEPVALRSDSVPAPEPTIIRPAASTPAPEPVVRFSAPPPPVPEYSAPERAANPAASAPTISAARVESSAPAEPESADEMSYNPASRLGGLRNLLVSLGMKSMNKDAEYSTQESDSELRNPERPVYAEPYASSIAVNGEAPTADAAIVTATPEFLPPRPLVETTAEREKEPVRPVAPKRAHLRDSTEDVETLPSWRGQYRKRR